jgi:prolipoprotein diacylglyceryltransferase
MSLVNDTLDALPRQSLGLASREVPTFRTCGIIGFYAALVVTFGGGLLAGRSLLVLACLSAVCAWSFFVWAALRRWASGGERLVLLEHVWFAEASVAAVLWAVGLPILVYLDAVAVGLAVFLAAGRTGCLLVGCCHGRPSSLGISYGEDCAKGGFPRRLVGIRLFPVQAVEAAGLLVIALTGLIALPSARPGVVFMWFLVAYAIMRFGLEGARGDARPELLGLSQNRWMCMGELALALWLTRNVAGLDPALQLAAGGFLAAVFGSGLLLLRACDRRRWLLADRHVGEVRDLIAAGWTAAPLAAVDVAIRTSSRGLTVAVSRIGAPGRPDPLQASFSLAVGPRDVVSLCELAARALPRLMPESGRLTAEGMLLVSAAAPGGDTSPGSYLGDELYGAVVRRLQASTEHVSAAARNRGYFDTRSGRALEGPYAGRNGVGVTR